MGIISHKVKKCCNFPSPSPSLGRVIITTEQEPGWGWDPSTPSAPQVGESSPALCCCRSLAATDAEPVPSPKLQLASELTANNKAMKNLI